MKTKNILCTVGFFVSLFSSCYSMDDMQTQNSSMTTMINNNMMRARGWMNNFYKTYQEFGIITTLSSSFNMYSFKRITGLNENELSNASSAQLNVAVERINKMIEYKGASQKLAQFLNKIETARVSKEISEEANPENISYDEEQTARDIEELLKQQRKQKRP
jgi:hypothetical protein